jgi:hypothetical protein
MSESVGTTVGTIGIFVLVIGFFMALFGFGEASNRRGEKVVKWRIESPIGSGNAWTWTTTEADPPEMKKDRVIFGGVTIRGEYVANKLTSVTRRLVEAEGTP